MIRNLKALGLLAIAALALSATFASVAQAEGNKGTFKGGLTPKEWLDTTIVGEQVGTAEDNFFEADGTKVECENSGVSFAGTLDGGTQTTLTITPTYTKCKAGGLPATVTMNGCDYIFTQPTTIAPLGTGKYTGKADLTCPTSTGPIVHVYLNAAHTINLCTVEIKAGTHTGEGANTHYVRELGGHVIYQNDSDAVVTEFTNEKGEEVKVKRDDVTVNADIKEIPYKKSGACGSKEGADAVYRNTVTVTGRDDVQDEGTTEHTEHYDVWIEDEAEE